MAGRPLRRATLTRYEVEAEENPSTAGLLFLGLLVAGTGAGFAYWWYTRDTEDNARRDILAFMEKKFPGFSHRIESIKFAHDPDRRGSLTAGSWVAFVVTEGNGATVTKHQDGRITGESEGAAF